MSRFMSVRARLPSGVQGLVVILVGLFLFRWSIGDLISQVSRHEPRVAYNNSANIVSMLVLVFGVMLVLLRGRVAMGRRITGTPLPGQAFRLILVGAVATGLLTLFGTLLYLKLNGYRV